MNYYKITYENGTIIYCSQDTLLNVINCLKEHTDFRVLVISETDYYDLYKDAFNEQC